MTYPPVQPVRTIPIVTGIFVEPNTFPTAVSMVEKKPPTKVPLSTTRAAATPSVLESGQTTHMLSPNRTSVVIKTLRAPNRSPSMPDAMRLIADAILNPAVSPAPALDDSLMDFAKRGMQ